jgi:ABC-2 type transport system permease protein
MNTWLMLIRREFWEHRSLWIAPLVWVGILTVLFAWFVFFKIENLVDDSARAFMDTPSVAELQSQMSEQDREELQRALEVAKDDRAQTPMAVGYFGISGLVSGFACIVVFFYLLDCLFAERRDRSILFWKSLPVSDAQVVICKLAVALVVVPFGAVVLSAVLQLVVLAIWSIKWSGTVIGQLTPDWNFLAWLRAQVVEAGVTLGGVMWYAPIAAYFLLLSVWVRKLVFLWAVVPLIALPLLEWFFTGEHHVAEFIGQRFAGYWKELNLDQNVFAVTHGSGMHMPNVHDVYDAIDISGMFTSLEAWIGIAAAAAMTFLAIRIRRYRDDS